MTSVLATIATDLERLVAELPVDQVPDLLGVLATVAARAQLRLATPTTMVSTATTNLTAEQVATALNIRPSAVYEWHRAKRIPGERFGRFLRFDLAAVRRALAEDSKTVRLGARKKPCDGGRNTGRSPAAHHVEAPV